MHDDPGSASFFADLSRELMIESQEQPTLQAVVERAVEVVPPCDAASITLRPRRQQLETVAATSELAGDCDRWQRELGEGPCVDSPAFAEPLLSGDLRRDARWPQWGARVADLGVQSVLSIQLCSSTEVIGSLNLFAAGVDAYQPDDVDLALIFATHAANALASARLVTGLRTAVESRHLIGVAQGILMHTYRLSLDQAFEVLRRYSSQTNVKLREVAELVVERRGLPTETADSLRDPV